MAITTRTVVMTKDDKHTLLIALHYAVQWEESVIDSYYNYSPDDRENTTGVKASRDNINKFNALRDKIRGKQLPVPV